MPDPAGADVFWTGTVEFHRSQLDENRQLLPGVTVRPLGWFLRAWRGMARNRAERMGARVRAAGTVDMELAGGRLEVRRDGIRWSGGSVLTPFGRTSGEFVLPWSQIQSATVVDVPGTASGLGGNLTIEMIPSGKLDGEFPGSQAKLRQALQRAREAGQSPTAPE